MLLPGEMILVPILWDLRLPLGHLRVFMPPGEHSFLVFFLPILLALVIISSAAINIQMSVGSSLSQDIAPVLAMATAATATALWRRHGCAQWKQRAIVAA